MSKKAIYLTLLGIATLCFDSTTQSASARGCQAFLQDCINRQCSEFQNHGPVVKQFCELEKCTQAMKEAQSAAKAIHEKYPTQPKEFCSGDWEYPN